MTVEHSKGCEVTHDGRNRAFVVGGSTSCKQELGGSISRIVQGGAACEVQGKLLSWPQAWPRMQMICFDVEILLPSSCQALIQRTSANPISCLSACGRGLLQARPPFID
jgi:hypothetical protein